jgi:predicted TIM-barrel fold metal-dependent hydrolase
MLRLTDIPIIDHHAHNLLKPEIASQYPYTRSFTEADDEQLIKNHTHTTLCYRRSIRDISTLLGCEAKESAILRQREKLGLEKLTRLCFEQGKIASIILDDGLLPEKILPYTWHQQFTSVYRLIRLEVLAKDLFIQAKSFEDFINQFRSHLESLPPNVVGFKSISAYRTGLAIEFVAETKAKSRFQLLKNINHNQPFRLTDKVLIDFILLQAFEIAAQSQIPIQFHTGFGDRDLDLFLANPLHLRPILENSDYQNIPIVLLHGSYPYAREVGYLASVYPQVYVDFGLAIPFLSVSGMRDTVQMLLELSPTSKILYSSDAHFIPELYYLGSLWGRKILHQVLESAINDGDLTDYEAYSIALDILRENASKLYHIN